MVQVSAREHSAALLAMVVRALESVNGGLDPRQQMCIELDELVGSDSAAYVTKGPSGELQLASSDDAPDRDLVQRAVSLVTSDARPFRFTHRGCPGHEFLDGACLPLTVSRTRTTALVFRGDLPDPAVLEEAGDALREVDRLLARLPDSQDRPHVPQPRAGGSDCSLTPREQEVLRLLGEGLLARTIAARLDLSPRTVHHHLGSIYDKLGVRDRLSAVLSAREQGLLSDRYRTGPGSPRPLAVASPDPSS